MPFPAFFTKSDNYFAISEVTGFVRNPRFYGLITSNQSLNGLINTFLGNITELLIRSRFGVG